MNMQPSFGRRTVLSFGAFDLSRPSETDGLRMLCGLGDELILGCVTDAFAQLHGLPCATPYTQRRRMLEHCRYVDRVIAQQTIGQIRTDIVNYNVCVFAVGSEWTGQFDGLQDIAQVMYLPELAGRGIKPQAEIAPLQQFKVAV